MTEAPPLKAVYPVTESLVDWLSNRMDAVEARAILYWQEVAPLKKLIDRGESSGSLVHRFKARSVVRNYSEEVGSDPKNVYEDIKDRCDSYVPTFEGEWVVFTDRSYDLLHMQDLDGEIVEDILYLAPLSVEWVIAWFVFENEIMVYRSPYIEDRPEIDDGENTAYGLLTEHTEGLPEKRPSFVLPPEAEALVIHDIFYETDIGLPTAYPPDILKKDGWFPETGRIETVSILDLIRQDPMA
jgi:hypothetical protein